MLPREERNWIYRKILGPSSRPYLAKVQPIRRLHSESRQEVQPLKLVLSNYWYFMTGWDLTTHMWVWLINELSLSNYYCCAVNSLFTRNSEEGVCTPPPVPASAEGHSVLSAGCAGRWAVGGGLRGPEDPLQPDCTLAWGCRLQWRKDDVMTESAVIVTWK